MVDIASLGIEVDATKADGGAKSLDSLTAAGGRAEAQMGKLGKQSGATATELAGYEARILAATMAQTGFTEAQARAALGLKASAQAETEAGAASVAASGVQVAGHAKVAASSLQVRESLVLLREASLGNFTRLAGSASILAGSFGLMTAGALAAAAAAAALAAPFVYVGAAIFAADEATNKFGATLYGLGPLTGDNVSQMEALAEATAKTGSVTVGEARNMEVALIRMGVTNTAVLSGLIDVSQDYATVTGEKLPAAMTELEKAFAHPIEGVKLLNEKLNLLDASTTAYITRLAEEGDVTGAQAVLMQKLAEQTNGAADAVGGLASNFHKAHLAASEFFAGVGRFFSADGGHTPNFSYLPQEEKTPQQTAQDKLLGRTANDLANELTLDTQRNKLKADQVLLEKAVTAGVLDSNLALRAEADIKTKLAALDKREAGPKPKSTPTDRTAEELSKLQAQAKGYWDLGAAQDVSTVAGIKAAAQTAANIEIARLDGDGTKRQVDAKRALAIATAELDVAVGKAYDAAGAKILQDDVQIDRQTLINQLMAVTGVSLQTATKQTADFAETQTLLANAQALVGSNVKDAGIKYLEIMARVRELGDAQVRLNHTMSDQVLVQQQLTDNNQISQLQQQIGLIGESNRVRAISLAQVKEMQSILAAGGNPLSQQGQKAIGSAGAAAGAGVDLAAAQDKYNTSLAHTGVLLGELKDATTGLGQSFTDAFGTAGSAIAKASSALVDHASALEKVTEERTKYLATQQGDADPVKLAEFDQKAADIRIGAYADTLQAAKSAFGTQTAAYKVLQSAEIAFRAIEEVGVLKSLALKSVDASTTVATEGVKQTAFGITAAAHALSSLPFPLNLAAEATVLAALAAIGVSLFGGGGGATTLPGATDAADRQKAQGAGSVLGDPTAQSKSLQNALTIAQSNQNKDLQYQSKMVTALQSIDANISTLTAAVAQDLGVGGALGTSGLNLGAKAGSNGLIGGVAGAAGGAALGVALGSAIAGPIGALVGAVLGSLVNSKTTNTLQDQGLQFGPQSIGQILANGLQGNSYNEVASETKTSFLGIGLSDKTKLNTTNTPLGADITGDLTRVIGSLESGVLAAASTIGVDGAKATLESLQLNLGTISLKGLTGSALTDAINAVFSKAGDDMAAAVLPGITQFQKAGEGAFETLTRLAHDYETVDVTLQSIGKTFATVGTASIAARENLVNLVGGLDTLTQETQDFATEFLTPAQQLAPVTAAVTSEMKRLGLAGLTTKDQFAALVQGLDVSTDAGAQLYAALLAVAPAFGKVADAAAQAASDAASSAAQAVTDAQNNVQTAVSALTSAYNGQVSAIQSTMATFKGFVTSLQAFDQSLGATDGSLSLQQQFRAAQATFQSTAGAAAGGDQTALGNLQNVSQAYLTAAKAVAPDAAAYAKDLAQVRNAVESAEGAAQHQVDVAQQQLDALNASVAGLIDLNSSVVDIAVLIGNVQDALAAQTAAENAQTALLAQQAAAAAAAQAAGAAAAAAALAAAAAPPTPPVAATPSPANDNAAIIAQIQANIAAAFSGGGGSRLGEFGPIQAFATGGSFTVGGSGGQDSQRFNLALSPGEVATVTHGDTQAAIVAELRALRQEVERQGSDRQAEGIQIAKNTGDLAKRIKRVTPNGDSLVTSVAA